MFTCKTDGFATPSSSGVKASLDMFPKPHNTLLYNHFFLRKQHLPDIDRKGSKLCIWYLDLHCKLLLLSKLDLLPLLLEVLVLCMLAQALQHVGFCDPLVTTQSLSDETGQLRVAVCQPPAWCHTIGLVLELFWCQIIEVLQQCTAAVISAILQG